MSAKESAGVSLIRTTHTVTIVDGTDQFLFFLPPPGDRAFRKVKRALYRHARMKSNPRGWMRLIRFQSVSATLSSLAFAGLCNYLLYRLSDGSLPGWSRTHVAIIAPSFLTLALVSASVHIARFLLVRGSWIAAIKMEPAEYAARHSGLKWGSLNDLLRAEEVRLGDMSSDPRENSRAAVSYAEWAAERRREDSA